MTADQNPNQKSNINIGSHESLVSVSEVHLNVSQEVIITTEDKVQLCLSKHLKRMEKKKGWIAPFGVLLTIIVTLVSSTFKDMGLDAATWKAIFIITGIISFVWLVYSVDAAMKSEKVEDIISELKKDYKSTKKL
jgi:hypothetical protein